MRLNAKKYKQMMKDRSITAETVRRLTGLSAVTFNWILKNENVEPETFEILCDAIGATTQELALPEWNSSQENGVEFMKGQERATASFSQRDFVKRVRKLSESYPEECQIVAANKDGSITAHFPVSWVTIGPPKKKRKLNLTEEQRREIAKRLKAGREAAGNL